MQPNRFPRVSVTSRAASTSWAIAASAWALAVGVRFVAAQSPAPDAARTTLSGVYTAAQATDGQPIFEATCLGGCHNAASHKGMAFEKRWAGMLLEQVLVCLREEFAAAGKIEAFDPLKKFLWGSDSSVSYAELSAQLGLSEGAARVAVHRFRQRYRELLRKGVADTVADPKDVDDELRHLISVISS
jgi:hypothetical protein